MATTPAQTEVWGKALLKVSGSGRRVAHRQALGACVGTAQRLVCGARWGDTGARAGSGNLDSRGGERVHLGACCEPRRGEGS